MRTMKNVILMGCMLILAGSCKKKTSGVCYCSYLSGDKKEFNMTSLPRDVAQDSCNVLSGYASNFAGSCKLK